MQNTTLTRRAALAGTVTLPAIALALPAAAEAALPAPVADDPAVRAFREFVPALRLADAAIERRGQMKDFGPDVDRAALAQADAEVDAAHAAELEALDALASAQATTAAGVRCQLVAFIYMTTDLCPGGDRLDMESYDITGFGPEELDLSNRMARAIDGALCQLAGSAA